jgi:hypothetical protein
LPAGVAIRRPGASSVSAPVEYTALAQSTAVRRSLLSTPQTLPPKRYTTQDFGARRQTAGRLGCFDARTRESRWSKEASEFGGNCGGWGYAESVLISGDWAIFKPGGEKCIVALNKQTGERDHHEACG